MPMGVHVWIERLRYIYGIELWSVDRFDIDRDHLSPWEEIGTGRPVSVYASSFELRGVLTMMFNAHFLR